MPTLEEMFEEERELQRAFRDDVRERLDDTTERLVKIESWAHEKRGSEAAWSKAAKLFAWGIGILFTAAGVILPLWFR